MFTAVFRAVNQNIRSLFHTLVTESRPQERLAYALALALMVYLYIQVDLPLAHTIAEVTPRAVKRFFRNLNVWGYSDVYFLLILLSVTLWSLAIVFHPATTLAQHASVLRKQTGHIFVGLFWGGVLVQIPKVILGRARPELWFDDQQYGFFGAGMDATFRSFPSGHATTAFCVAFMLWPFVPFRWRWVLLVFAVIVSMARVVLLKHYASDILAGALLAYLVCKVMHERAARRGRLLCKHNNNYYVAPPLRKAYRWLVKRVTA